jgi:type I restriction enzyme R subunit
MPPAVQAAAPSSNAARTNLAERLQQIVLGWRGAERNQPVSDLHAECAGAAGAATHLFLPERVFPVRALDAGTLRAELARRRLLRSEDDPRFRVRPTGRFDAALVPGGVAGQPCDRWWMFVEEGLAPRDQHALYAHVLGHGLLNEEARRLGQNALPLDPRDGYAHRELLGELRLLENARQPQDRRVLEAYPQLAELLRPSHEPAVTGPTDPTLLDRLGRAGWRGERLDAPYVYTSGRVYVSEGGIHRGRRLRADALLRAERSLPVAVAQLLRPGEEEEDAVCRLEELAQERLGVPFAYLVLPGSGLIEIDRASAGEVRQTTLSEFPGPGALLDRWMAALQLNDEQARHALCFPYEVRRDQPLRYYQELAINRAVAAALQARRGLRKPRVLITLATGTGKTKVAFQIVWKLKQARVVKNVLFITDRDWLLTQAMDNEFAPFREARARIRGELKTAQDIFFATYQALAGAEGRAALYDRYPRNYFDLVIIDECHRGSAQDDSNWRTILEHFDSAVQIGMTATPLRTDNVDTYNYFTDPVAVYSLRRGINDGFLAPYRVRRVLMRRVGELEAGSEAPSAAPVLSEEEQGNLEAGEITAGTLVSQTDAVAAHLARYLRATDLQAKTIVFCVDQDHADRMRLALERELADQVAEFGRRGQSYVERIVAEEGTDGRRTLGRFSNPEENAPVIVTTSRLLSTGVDVPTCKNVVLARPVNSIVEFKQIIGRGTRLLEPQKTWFTIVDYAGATKHFYDEEWDGDPQFVDLDTLLPPALPGQSEEGEPTNGAAIAGNAPTTVTNPSVSPAPVDVAPSPNQPVPTPAVASDSSTLDTTSAAHQVPGVSITGIQVPVTEVNTGTSVPSAAAVTSVGEDGVTTPPLPTPVSPTPAPPGDPVIPPTAGNQATSTPGPPVPATQPALPPQMPTAERRTRRRDGRQIAVVGEVIYELGPDGRTLKKIPYLEYAREAIGNECPTLEALRERWLNPDLRGELEGLLDQDGVDLNELAAVFNLSDCDPLDVLSYALFRTPVPTRQDRVKRLAERHAAWLDTFSAEAREILDLIVRKFVDGEAPQVTDTGLLRVPPLSERGTFMELTQRFGGGAGLRSTLAELHRRLYEQ